MASQSASVRAWIAMLSYGVAVGSTLWWLSHRREARTGGAPAVVHRRGAGERTLPRRIILVRHGESVGNVDKRAYEVMPDHLIPLTPRGQTQATEAGVRIRDMIPRGSPVAFFISPFERTRQTFACMYSVLHGHVRVLFAREEPRVREQEFGAFQEVTRQRLLEEERQKFGRFFYRFPQGESGADVYDRVSTFLDSMFRACAQSGFDANTTFVIVTHGLSLRLFLMRYFYWPVALFERTTNPANASVIVMERVPEPSGARLALTHASQAALGLSDEEVRAAMDPAALLLPSTAKDAFAAPRAV